MVQRFGPPQSWSKFPEASFKEGFNGNLDLWLLVEIVSEGCRKVNIYYIIP